MTTTLRNTQVGEGDNAVDLALFPWEDAQVVADELEQLFAEVDAGIAWIDDDSPAHDPSYQRWLDEGAPSIRWNFAGGIAGPGELDALEDEPGYSESRQPWLY